MDIHILRNGEQLGPYTEDAVQELLKSGTVHIDDPAWRPGMEEWIPLVRLLYPAAAPIESEPAAEAAESSAGAAREPASKRQKAFLSYMGIDFPPEIEREDASLFINDAMENPTDPERLARWNEERLRLHPELFAAEVQAQKESRAQRFLERCEHEGATCFEGVTKAHCQVLVGHLDVRFPSWDADEREAVWKYFLPALAEKFPQLVTEEGREKLKHLEGGKAPDHHTSHSLVVTRPRPASAGRKLLAIVRGGVIGGVILGVLWVGQRHFEKDRSRAGGTAKDPSSTPGSATTADGSQQSSPSAATATNNEPAAPPKSEQPSPKSDTQQPAAAKDAAP